MTAANSAAMNSTGDAMGTTPSKPVQKALALLKKDSKLTGTDAAKKAGCHVTTLYRYKPYQAWRKANPKG
jgi:hypothetical protein